MMRKRPTKAEVRDANNPRFYGNATEQSATSHASTAAANTDTYLQELMNPPAVAAMKRRAVEQGIMRTHLHVRTCSDLYDRVREFRELELELVRARARTPR